MKKTHYLTSCNRDHIENTYPYNRDGIADQKAQLEEAADKVISRTRELRRRLVEDIIAIGGDLAAAHAILSGHGNGTWGRWVEGAAVSLARQRIAIL